MKQTHQSTSSQSSRRSAQVVLVDSDRFTMLSSWFDRLELHRDSRPIFVFVALFSQQNDDLHYLEDSHP